MSATSNPARDEIQTVIRRVPCPRCRASVNAPCFSGRQKNGKYLRTMPDSHFARWTLALDSGHIPLEAWDPLHYVQQYDGLGEHPALPAAGRLR